MNRRLAWFLLLALALTTAGCVSMLEDPRAEDPGDDPQPTGNETDAPGQDEDQDDEDEDPGSDDGDDEDQEEDEDTRTGDEDEHPPWPSPENASIRPGVTIDGVCTSNFVFRTPSNSSLMLGTAAHCFADNPNTNTNGCEDNVDPVAPGAKVNIEGASEPGILLYSSWHSMQQANETDDQACQYNDFALVLIPTEDRANVSPAMLEYGGPTGLAEASDASTGDKVLWYGSSSYRNSIEEIQANEGYLLSAGSWSATMYGVPPGVPGDSGSAITLASGEALGVLSTVRITPETGSNGIALLEPMLSYAASMNVPVELVEWEQLDDGTLPG